MQKARQPHFRDRCLYYTSFPIQKRAPRGVKLFPLKAVYLVAVLDFVLFNENEEDKERVINSVHLVRDETNTRFSDKLNMVFVELPKFKKNEQELQSNVDNWLFSLRNMSKMDKLPEKLKGEIFEQLFEIAEIKRLTKEDDMEAYRKSILDYEDVRSAVDLAKEEAFEEGEERGLVKGREEGEEKGREEANETFVQKSLRLGLPIDIIINLTGYSEEQILRLKNKKILTDI
jgi:predicted transposase/invertase (TIGR01784 family)